MNKDPKRKNKGYFGWEIMGIISMRFGMMSCLKHTWSFEFSQ